MILNQAALILCLILLLVSRIAAFRALRKGETRLVRVFQLLRLGLGLSACSYALRLMLPASDPARVASFFCTLAGSLLIWTGTLEHVDLRRYRLLVRAASPEGEPDDGLAAEIAFPTEAGLLRLNSCAGRVWSHAVDEARRRHRCCVDTDHLLLGLLQEPRCAGADILERLDVRPENIRLALGQPSAPRGDGVQDLSGEALPLTSRADQAFACAVQEARRFGKASVGTDHLLLGLVLMGTGAAAISLFQEGVTVDGIRGEIIKVRAR
jgi:hypothetical protein